MKIASYNIQNLFHRDKNLVKKSFSKNVQDWITELDTILVKPKKTDHEKDRVRELSFLLGFENTRKRPFAVLRKKAGLLFFKGIQEAPETKASVATEWNGWIEIQTLPITPEATNNKARVIADVNADILLLHEIEDRGSLEEFNTEILPKFNCKPYAQTVVIQNTEMNGMETGMLLREGYTLTSTKSHAIGGYSDGFQYVMEFEVVTPEENNIMILAVYLRNLELDEKIATSIRKSQVINITKIYDRLKASGNDNIIVTGHFNAPSYCNSLQPLLENTDLKDITKHLSFDVDCDLGADSSYFRLGGYTLGVNVEQLDYMFFSPNLFEKLVDSGINRKAVFPDKRPQWRIYNSVTSKDSAGSEFPLVGCTISFDQLK